MNITGLSYVLQIYLCVYARFRLESQDNIHRNVERAGLDLELKYRQQDNGKLSNVFRLVSIV